MTPQEKFNKENGITGFARSYKEAHDYYKKYSKWLEKKITWNNIDVKVESFPIVIKWDDGDLDICESQQSLDLLLWADNHKIIKYLKIGEICTY